MEIERGAPAHPVKGGPPDLAGDRHNVDASTLCAETGWIPTLAAAGEVVGIPGADF